jgi:hypothetical protein
MTENRAVFNNGNEELVKQNKYFSRFKFLITIPMQFTSWTKILFAGHFCVREMTLSQTVLHKTSIMVKVHRSLWCPP